MRDVTNMTEAVEDEDRLYHSWHAAIKPAGYIAMDGRSVGGQLTGDGEKVIRMCLQ